MAGDDFTGKLGTLSPAIVREVSAALFAAGSLVQVEAQISITTGATSGKNHTPSAAGEAPNADTHFLANNIETLQLAPLKVEISSNAPYSAALEFGTSKMAERPFMRPAAIRTERKITEFIAKATARAMAKHFRK